MKLSRLHAIDRTRRSAAQPTASGVGRLNTIDARSKLIRSIALNAATVNSSGGNNIPDYMRAYRQSAARWTAIPSAPAVDLHELLGRVKNNLVFDRYKRDMQGGLLIDLAEAEIVRRIVSMRGSRCSLGAIATALNEAGRLTKRGKQFYPSTIRYILDNAKYRGLTEYY